jgi:hypothetical protein
MKINKILLGLFVLLSPLFALLWFTQPLIAAFTIPSCATKPAGLACTSYKAYYTYPQQNHPDKKWDNSWYLSVVQEEKWDDSTGTISRIYCPMYRYVWDDSMNSMVYDTSVAAKKATDCFTSVKQCTNWTTCTTLPATAGIIHPGDKLPSPVPYTPPSGGDPVTPGDSGGTTPGVDSGGASGFGTDPWGEGEECEDPADACDADPANCLEKAGTESNKVWNILKLAINILSGAVLVAAVIMLIISAIQYSTSGGDPNGVKAAKSKITNVLIGVAAYIFLYSFLQWLIPGGAF